MSNIPAGGGTNKIITQRCTSLLSNHLMIALLLDFTEWVIRAYGFR